MATLSIRIKLDSRGRIGPGKVDLLEKIAAFGSISAAGREMAMSYRRAWELVEELNTMFATPAVERQVGGRNGGGARLTPFGQSIVDRYRSIERAAEAAARGHLEALESEAEPLRAEPGPKDTEPGPTGADAEPEDDPRR